VRVGRIDGEFVINPTLLQKDELEMDVIVAVSDDAILMVEGEASGVSEEVMVDGLLFAKEQAKPLLDMQRRLVDLCGREKRPFEPPQSD